MVWRGSPTLPQEASTVSVVHDVPLCRQRIEEAEWDQQSGWSLGDRVEWSDRACGVADLRMILLAYGREAPTVTELVKLGVKEGALTDRGWIHAKIADLAAGVGVPGLAEPVDADDLTRRLDTAPLIVSVTERLPKDGRKGGHLIVVHGYQEGPDPLIFIRDPSSWGQTHSSVPLSRLAASYTGRAITFPPLPAKTSA